MVFLSRAANLKSPMGGAGYYKSICDSRVDVTETSTQCLSYSMSTRSVGKNGGGTGTENIPLMPTLGPLKAWTDLFQNFVEV